MSARLLACRLPRSPGFPRLPPEHPCPGPSQWAPVWCQVRPTAAPASKLAEATAAPWALRSLEDARGTSGSAAGHALFPEPVGFGSLVLVLQLNFPLFFSAMIVRFLTKRFIGDYEPNTG